MANDIKINIITDYKQTSDALNKVTGGVGAYRKAIIAAGNDQEKLSKSRKDFANALAREGSQFEKYGESLESVKKIREMVAKELNYLTTGMGMEDETVKALTSTYQIYDDRLKKLNQSKEEESRKTKEAIALAEEHNLVMKQTLAELESMYEARKALNDKNAPIGFMVLEGDEIGVAKYALTEYRKTLEEIISATGINSKETEKAYQAYKKQESVVNSLTEREKAYNAMLKEQEAILNRINSRYEEYEAKRYKTGPVDAGNGFSFDQSNMRFYGAIGDTVGYAREELKMYESQLRHVLASENASADAVKAATEAYKQQKQAFADIQTAAMASSKGVAKFASVFLNIIKFQLVLKVMNLLRTSIRESAQAAAEAEQVFSKLETVFSGVEASARKMASTLSSEIGVAVSTAASALSTVGDLLQAQGMGTAQSLSTAAEWVSKFQDIIAFKDLNMSLEEFSQNFMSGAAGNLRNFRTFGSIVKESAVNARLAAQGLDTLTGSQLELAKMTTRATMALEQQANAEGATKREWETSLSINRRYQEANKQLKENIGESINDALNPLKQAWADVADQINKAKKAQDEYNAGSKNISVYDLSNRKDQESFIKALNNAQKTILGGADINPVSVAEKMVKIMTEYNATLEDVDTIYGAINAEVRAILVEEDLKLQKLREEEIHLDNIRASWTSMAESSGDIISSLDAIKGFDMGSWGDAVTRMAAFGSPTTDSGLEAMADSLASRTINAIRSGLNSFDESDWSTFTSALDNAFGESTEVAGLEEKLSQVKNIYSVINAYVKEDAIVTEEEQEWLDKIFEIYGKILARQKEITAETERQKALQSANDSLVKATNDYRKQIYQFDMTDREKAFDDLERQYKALIDIEGLDAAQKATLEVAYQQEVAALTRLLDLQDERTKRLEEEARIAEEIKRSEERTSSFISGGASNRLAIEQFGMSDMEKALDDLARAYRELTFEEQNDLSEAYLQQADDIRELYRLQDEYNKKLEAQAKIRKEIEASEKRTGDFISGGDANRLAIAQFGMTDEEKEIYNLRQSYLKLDLEEQNDLADVYQEQIDNIRTLYKLQQEYNNELKREELLRKASSDRQALLYANAQTASDYRLQATQLGMSSSQITRMGLTNQAAAAIDAEDMELYRSIMETVKAFDELTQKTKEYEDELARQQAWQNLGQSALNSVGPVGSAINTMVNGDGDIWTRLLEVVLDIFQQSEHWSEVVDALNQIIQPILPLVEMIAYTLQSLAPVWEAISFVLKIVSTVIAQILGGINMVIDVIQWAWDNLKIALKNLSTDIYNWTHWNNKKEREDYKNILDYWEETADETNDVLYKIWHGVTDDSSINYLEELLKRDIITVDQYNAGLRVAQKNMVFDPVTPAQYVASSSAGGSTVQYGNVTLTINGGNIEETQRVVINVMREAGYDIGNVPLYA